MKKHKRLQRLSIFFLMVISAIACKKEDPSLVLPEVETLSADQVEAHAARLHLELLQFGDSQVSEFGFVLSEEPLPTLTDGQRITMCCPDSLGVYSATVSDELYSNTQYFYRAYAVNKAGVAYGEEKTFQTKIAIPDKLNFSLLTEIRGYNFHQAIGFAGTASPKALFIANRQIDPVDRIQYERLWRYDLEAGSSDSLYNPIVDYISKEMQIVNGQPYVIGSEYMSVYEFDLEEMPVVNKHGRQLTRHGSALYNDDIYIWGGDRNRVDSDKIFRYNYGSGQFEYVATMPGPKAYAAGAIVNNKLYVFGGQQQFSGTLRENKIYVYDLGNDSFETYFLPDAPYHTYTAIVGQLIYVAGQINPTGEDTTDILFGVFDTRDNTFTEIPINLTDEAVNSIWALTAIGNTLYVVYGDPLNDVHEVTGLQTFTIQQARIP